MKAPTFIINEGIESKTSGYHCLYCGVKIEGNDLTLDAHALYCAEARDAKMKHYRDMRKSANRVYWLLWGIIWVLTFIAGRLVGLSG